MGIKFSLAIANWLLTKLRWRIHPDKTDDPDVSTADTATKKQHQNNFRAIEARLLFYFQILLWVA